MSAAQVDERLRRWRLVLGASASKDGTGITLTGDELRLDAALAALYDAQGFGDDSRGRRSAGLGASSPSVTRWLGDIRRFFPKSVVQVMQKDAMERLDLRRLLLEPEMLESVEPDVHLVGTLLSLNSVIPERTKATARLVVRRVVEGLERRLASPLRQAITGSLNRSGRKTAALRDIILCVDQSSSMAGSIVYSSTMAAVMASLRAVKTSLVFFDTAVVDMTEKLADPVDVLFGAQLGGGTDIHRAVSYCQGLIARPAETIFVLISDLIEGGSKAQQMNSDRPHQQHGLSVLIRAGSTPLASNASGLSHSRKGPTQ